MPVHSELHGHGPAVVFTHGYGSTSHMFAPVVPALAPDYTVVTWDLRGHGRSVVPEHPGEFTVERSLHDLTELLDAAGADRAVLGGHSLGGYLSLAYALAAPERVAGLILIGTGPGYRKAGPRAEWNEMCEGFARALEERGMAGLGGGDEADASRHVGGPAGLIFAARGILPQHEATVIDGLASISAPALVVVGDRDRRFLDSSRYLATKLPAARLVTIEDCGHAPPLEQPTAFAAAVREFVDALPH